MKGEMPQDGFNYEDTFLSPTKYLLLAAFAVAMSGCGLVVLADDYQKDVKKRDAEMQFIRKQMLAHTQILANHGKMINEARLQIRDALSLVKSSAAGMRQKAAKKPKKKRAAPPEGGREKTAGDEAPPGEPGHVHPKSVPRPSPQLRGGLPRAAGEAGSLHPSARNARADAFGR